VTESCGGGERGRGLRFQLAGLEWASDAPWLAGDTLRAIPGVLDVKVDRFTGSIAVVYAPPAAPEPPARLEASVPVPARRPAIRRPAPRLTALAETVVVVALEVALQQALGPLLWRRRG